jgi:uncharacterized protein
MTESSFNHIKDHVKQLLESKLSPYLFYHCAEHTFRVLDAAQKIAVYEKISPKENSLLQVAVLYHDLGFINTIENHEEESCRLARIDLTQFGLEDDEIDIVCEMILTTRIPRIVSNKLDAIIADADLEYLGTDDFEIIGARLYNELRHSNPNLREAEWNQIQLKFLENHKYFTEYGQLFLEPVKQHNLAKLRMKH